MCLVNKSVWSFFDANPTRFAFNHAAWNNTNLPTRYTVDETVPAVYGMATTNIGALRLNGGVRYDRTQSNRSTRFRFILAAIT